MRERVEEYRSAEEIRREIADLRIQLAFQEKFEEEVNEILVECENPSPDMLKVICEEEGKIIDKISQQRRNVFNNMRNILQTTIGKVAAIIIAVVIISGSSAMATIQLIRAGLFELNMYNMSQYTALHMVQIDNLNVPSEWNGYYYPTFIPDGFEYVPKYTNESGVIYVNENGEWLSFGEYTIGVGVTIDTENAEISYGKINGADAMIIKKNGISTVIWSVGNRFFIVDIVGEKELVIQIAESVTMIR